MRVPFDSTSIAANRGVEPHKLMSLLRGDLDWIVMRCLEKDRTRRYETASGLASDIQRYLADEPVEARRPTRLYRLKKFVRRNKTATVAAALILAALVAGAGVATWGLIEARRGRTLAESTQQDLKTTNEQLASQLIARSRPNTWPRNNRSNWAANFTRSACRAPWPAFTMASSVWPWKTSMPVPKTNGVGNGNGLHQASMRIPVEIRGRQLPQFTPNGSQVVAVDGADEKCVKFWNA